MPSSSIDSCAELSGTVPLAARDHTKRPFSRRFIRGTGNRCTTTIRVVRSDGSLGRTHLPIDRPLQSCDASVKLTGADYLYGLIVVILTR